MPFAAILYLACLDKIISISSTIMPNHQSLSIYINTYLYIFRFFITIFIISRRFFLSNHIRGLVKTKMRFTILDCYTDEPSGLGVPPYLITYPRYIAGAILKYNRDNKKGDINNTNNNNNNNNNNSKLNEKHDYFYLTIDDIRLHKFYNGKIKNT